MESQVWGKHLQWQLWETNIVRQQKSCNCWKNVSDSQEIRPLYLQNSLCKYFKNAKYKVVKRNRAIPKRGTLSISKAKKLLGYKPKYNLERGTAKYIDFLKGLDLQLDGAAKFPKALAKK